MAEVKLRALGLREVDFGDYDRYLTALTADGRRIEILCKNARRGKKQNPAARQFCYSEFILYERGGKYTLREAGLVHSFFPLTQDIRAVRACLLSGGTGKRAGHAGRGQSGTVRPAAARVARAGKRRARADACQGCVRVARDGRKRLCA